MSGIFRWMKIVFGFVNKDYGVQNGQMNLMKGQTTDDILWLWFVVLQNEGIRPHLFETNLWKERLNKGFFLYYAFPIL